MINCKKILLFVFLISNIILAQGSQNRLIRFNDLDSILAARGLVDTVGLATASASDREPGIALFRQSNETVDYVNFWELGDSMDVADSSEVAERFATVENDIDSLYTKTSHIVNVDEFIAGHDTTLGWQDVLNEATQYCITNSATLYLPARRYMIKDTWWIGTPSTFTSVNIVGSLGYVGYKGSVIYADFGDRPAINIQGARLTTIQGLNVVGKNLDKVTTAIATMPNDESEYIDAGLTSGRYNPYAGITIDGYTSPQPDSQYYTNHAYNGAPSYGVTLRDVNIMGFVVGVALDPSATNSNGDNCALERVHISFCTYGVSAGGSQNREFIISNCGVGATYYNFTTRRFGNELAPAMRIIGGLYGLSYGMFDFTGDDVTYVAGIYAESIKKIGNLGGVGTVDGANFAFTLSNSYGLPDAIAIINGGITFNGCLFGTQETGILNIVGSNATFNNCRFWTLWDDIYYAGRSYYNAPIMTFNNSTAFTLRDGWSYIPFATNNKRSVLTTRIEYPPFTSSYQTKDSLYTIYSGADVDYGHIIINVDTTYWFEDTLNIETITTGEILEDDIIYWQTSLYGASQYIVPMLKIESVSGTSAKASKLFDSTNYDYTYDPDYMFIAQREWASNVNLTGDITSGKDTIFNVSDTSVVIVGDFIKGTGLPTITRVEYVGGDTIVISKNATATITGTPLYFGKIKNIRPDLNDLSGIENLPSKLGEYLPTDSTGLVSNEIYTNYIDGIVHYRIPAAIIDNGDFNDWEYGGGFHPVGYSGGSGDTTHAYLENTDNQLHIISDGLAQLNYYYEDASAVVGKTYGYSFEVIYQASDSAITIGTGGGLVNPDGYSSVLSLGVNTGRAVATSTFLFSFYTLPSETCDIIIDNVRIWEIGGDVQAPIYPFMDLNLHEIATGDSVLFRIIIDAADTTMKTWNGTNWITIKDLIP